MSCKNRIWSDTASGAVDSGTCSIDDGGGEEGEGGTGVVGRHFGFGFAFVWRTTGFAPPLVVMETVVAVVGNGGAGVVSDCEPDGAEDETEVAEWETCLLQHCMERRGHGTGAVAAVELFVILTK